MISELYSQHWSYGSKSIFEMVEAGTELMRFNVEKGDIWRMSRAKGRKISFCP